MPPHNGSVAGVEGLVEDELPDTESGGGVD